MKPFLVTVVCALALAQTDAEPASVRRMRADLEFLCADRLEGRLSLARGADLAASYIAAAFARLGLRAAAGNSYLQTFPVVAYEPDRQRTRLAIVRQGQSTVLQMGHDFRSATAREVTVSAPLVFAGYGISAPEYGYDDYRRIDVHGKVVLLFDHEPQETDQQSVFNGTGHTRHANSRVKAENARRHGAVAVLIASEPLRKHAGAFDPAPRATGERSLRANAPRQALEDGAIPLLQISDRVAATLLAPAGKTPAELQAAIDHSLTPASQDLPGITVELV